MNNRKWWETVGGAWQAFSNTCLQVSNINTPSNEQAALGQPVSYQSEKNSRHHQQTCSHHRWIMACGDHQGLTGPHVNTKWSKSRAERHRHQQHPHQRFSHVSVQTKEPQQVGKGDSNTSPKTLRRICTPRKRLPEYQFHQPSPSTLHLSVHIW